MEKTDLCGRRAGPRRAGTRTGSRRSGFTVVELLVVIAILGLGIILALPALQNLIIRSKLMAMGRETATLVHAARLEAIKRSQPAILQFDLAEGQVEAYIDEDGDGEKDAMEPVLSTLILPSRVDFGAPMGDPMEIAGFTPRPSGNPPNHVVFRTDGAIDDSGAIRFVDDRDNFVEVRIEPRATARVRIRKWDEITSRWLESGEGGTKWEWN